MAEYTSIKLKPDEQLLLDQPLLRLPYELSRNNFKSAQIAIDQTSKKVNEIVNNAVKSSASSSDPAATAANSLDQAITRLNNLKRKLSQLNESSSNHTEQSRARIDHLDRLHDIPNLADVKYEDWSRVRLDRLLVDYLLRMGFTKSAGELAREKAIEKLVDVGEFEAVGKIERSLREDRQVNTALSWCSENKQSLKKINSNFELELRLQQVVELARTGDMTKLLDAVTHTKKYLSGHPDSDLGMKAAGLLAYPPETQTEPYKSLYSLDRWNELSKMFLDTHHTLFTLPQKPLLTIALSAGLSALKTPACHSRFVSPSSGLNSSTSPKPNHPSTNNANDPYDSEDITMSMSLDSIAALEAHEASHTIAPSINASLQTSVCPICSTELNKLARNVPYAHHSKSHVENDPLVLPNGRIYGRERLERTNEKLGTPRGLVRDPVDPSLSFAWEEVRKVFIS